MGPSRRKYLLFVTLVVSVLLSGCARRGRGVELPMPAVSTGKAVMHAVQDERLRELMRGLRTVAFDRLPQELDEPARERDTLREAIGPR